MSIDYVLSILRVFLYTYILHLILTVTISDQCYYLHLTDKESNIQKIKSYSKWLSLELSSGISELPVPLYTVSHVNILNQNIMFYYILFIQINNFII